MLCRNQSRRRIYRTDVCSWASPPHARSSPMQLLFSQDIHPSPPRQARGYPHSLLIQQSSSVFHKTLCRKILCETVCTLVRRSYMCNLYELLLNHLTNKMAIKVKTLRPANTDDATRKLYRPIIIPKYLASTSRDMAPRASRIPPLLETVIRNEYKHGLLSRRLSSSQDEIGQHLRAGQHLTSRESEGS